MLAIAKKYFEAKKENTLCSDRNLDARIFQEKFEMWRAASHSRSSEIKCCASNFSKKCMHPELPLRSQTTDSKTVKIEYYGHLYK